MGPRRPDSTLSALYHLAGLTDMGFLYFRVQFLGFLSGLEGKESACNVGDLSSIPGLGRLPGEGKGYALQYSGLENSMDCIVRGVAKSQTRQRDFHLIPGKANPGRGLR